MINTIFSQGKKNLRRFAVPLLLFILGAALLFMGRGTAKDTEEGAPSSSNAPAPSLSDAEAYTDKLEKKVERLLSGIDGISNVTVLLTLDGGSEFVYAENTNGGTVDYLILEGTEGEEALLIREIYASVRGIAVVCRGGGEPSIQKTVAELLSSAFNIPLSKISVAGAR